MTPIMKVWQRAWFRILPADVNGPQVWRETSDGFTLYLACLCDNLQMLLGRPGGL